MESHMLTEGQFYTKIELASDWFLKKAREKKEPSRMVHDGDVMSAAASFQLEATGTFHACPVTRAIVLAAYERSNAIGVLAAAKVAWDHYQASAGAQKTAA